MGFNSFISKIFGNKAQRDLNEINPIVNTIKEAYTKMEQLSNDELRAKTKELEKRIEEYVAEDSARIAELKAGVEEVELEKRESVWNEIDKIEKEITSKLEKILSETLPEAFSIVKETAKRFNDNAEIVVTATDFDRDLAAKHDFVHIEGDKAVY
ncbi:MAG: preprotein translocase subunit SecA, partial [Petrimonas sp.]|nr:preprotein translocase subunit SecA [Petrimonas sp.]